MGRANEPMDGWDKATGAGHTADPFLPSEYTGLLLQAVRQLPDPSPDHHAVEIGVGSGVVLASLGLRGFGRLRGVDSHPSAVHATGSLLRRLALDDRAEVTVGSVWDSLDNERFDLVVANLPQFPTEEPVDAGRIASWATGGADGRRIMDPFLAGLGAHLRPGGIALITHSTVIGLARTRAILGAQGLGYTSLMATQVMMQPRKWALLGPACWSRADELGLTAVGPYRFLEAHVLRIGAL